ncbi:MAG: aminotransferase class IV [Fidelibacterota bacterium]|jgi:branched-chain amino acid aminotransferase|nr:aminotransferase class IV [Candidatus Neomarinimicrobiota bacterium]|tara:strand:+ start:4144 stop:5049 length:906 start_codon:yes stop_codon:yes gene_type:complete
MTSTHEYKEDVRNKDIQIYINGEFYHRSKAYISVLDAGFLLGDGVWEGIRLHNGILLHLDDHLDRLFYGANEIALEISTSKEELKKILTETLEKNNMFSDVHIRLIISRGLKKTPYQHPKVTIGDPSIVIIPEYKKPDPKVGINGIRLAIVSTLRDNRVQNPHVNSLSKHNCIAACIEADKKGADEGLMLDPYGYISTCNSTNFFIIKSNEVWTSTGEHCLNGITRQNVIRICKEKQISLKEKNFNVKDVLSAHEIFVTGTFAGIIPVISVDEKVIGNGIRGEKTKILQDYYIKDIESKNL